jgi:hypothetical protein
MQNVFYLEMKTLEPPAATPVTACLAVALAKAGSKTTAKTQKKRRLAEAKAHATLMGVSKVENVWRVSTGREHFPPTNSRFHGNVRNNIDARSPGKGCLDATEWSA